MSTKNRVLVGAGALVARRFISALAVAAMLFGAAVTTVHAQQSGGSIRGTVYDADASTVVEIVDASRGTSKTDNAADGKFRFDNLTPGEYELRLSKGGTVVDTATVTVSLGSTTDVNMATTATMIEEIITTGTRVAAMDTSIAESGLVIDMEELIAMPVQRDLTSVALLAPGTLRGDYRFGDNGNVAFAGASIAENTSFINGLNTTNFRTGIGFSQVPFEFYETIQVKTGGYSAKYGRSLGGVMNARTKSGSNDWKFGANVYYTEELEQSPETFIAANKQDEDSSRNMDLYVSGPIIKDRLFFYALFSDNAVDQRYAGLQSGRDFDFDQDEGFWGFKLDGYITDNHHLEYTMFTDERTGVEGSYAFDAATRQRGAYIGDTLYERGGENWIATYTGDLTNNLQVSVSYGENEYNRTTAPASADIPVVYSYTNAAPFQALGNWSNFTVSSGADTREMTRVDVKYILGDHDISVGYDSEVNTSIDSTINSGGVYWLLDPLNEYEGCDVVTQCPRGANARKRTYDVGGTFETTSDAFYIQDVWNFNENWTFEVGLRNESFENLNGEGGVFVKIDDQWAPRLAAVFDPNGDGRSKYFANYGLYYIPIASNTNVRMAGNETYIQEYFDWDGVSVDGQFQPTNLGPLYATDLFGDGTVPDTRSTTDVNIEPMYQSEFILGYARTLDSDIVLGVKGIYRNLETTIEDVAIDAAVIDYYNSGGSWDPSLVGGASVEDVFSGFHQYVLTNPGNPMRIYIPEQNEFIDLSPAQLGYPEAEREYTAVEFTLSRPFDGRWGADMSYTWSHSEGNHEGYVKSDNGQDDAGITQNFDQPGLVDFSYGDLPNDRRHTVKVFGYYHFDNGFRLSANTLYQSGRPISCFGLHPTDVFAQAYGASSHFCGGEGVQRGSLGTTPDIMTVDLQAQYSFDMGRTNVLLSLDLFNVLNSQNATLIYEYGETGGGQPDTDYGKIQQYQSPRAMRLSARFSFD